MNWLCKETQRAALGSLKAINKSSSQPYSAICTDQWPSVGKSKNTFQSRRSTECTKPYYYNPDSIAISVDDCDSDSNYYTLIILPWNML